MSMHNMLLKVEKNSASSPLSVIFPSDYVLPLGTCSLHKSLKHNKTQQK